MDGFVIFFPLVVYSQGRDVGFATVVKQPRRVSVNRGVQHELVFRVHLDLGLVSSIFRFPVGLLFTSFPFGGGFT